MVDTARFEADANAAAASVGRIGAAAKKSSAEATGLAGALGRVGAAGKKMTGIGRLTRARVTTPLLAVAGASIYASVHFSRAMELIHTQAGATQHEVGVLKKQVLDLADIEPQGPIELANALYRLEGAGLRGRRAMSALRASADLATVGNANVEDTAKTLAQTWFVGIKGAGRFRDTVAELNATVGAGDLRMQQLVDALGVGVLPAAKEAGLSLQDVTGAMAVFGDETNNVSGFMAQFATALHFLYNPGIKSEKALERIGLSGRHLAEDMRKPRGMLRALTDLRNHLDRLPGGHKGIDAEQVLGDIFPGGRGRVMLVLLNQLDRYKKKMDQIAGTHKDFGEAVEKSGREPLVRMQKAWSSVQVAAVKFGDALVPTVVPIIEKLAGAVRGVVNWFTKLDPKQRRIVLGLVALAAAAGPVLIVLGLVAGGISAIGTALIFVSSNPIVLIIAGLVALGAGLVILWKKSETFRNIVTGAFHVVWSVMKLIPTVWVIRQLAKIVSFANAMPGKITLHGLWEGLKSGLVDALNFIIDKINFVIRQYNKIPIAPNIGAVGRIRQDGTAMVNANTQAYGKGYSIPTPMPVTRKHKKAQGGSFSDWSVVGERGPELARHTPSYTEITPLATVPARGNWPGDISIRVEAPLIMNGREVARVTADEKAEWNARKGKSG
jgi:TP901 family phage tail tape measure protein